MNLGSILPVGTIIHSMLTTTQFASEYGDNWVLADGRSVSGTKYELVTGLGTIPDMTGRFLRGRGANNPDGTLALGTYSADKLVSHSHTSGANPDDATSGTNSIHLGAAGATINFPTSSVGSNETAPKSITVNIFIRIN